MVTKTKLRIGSLLGHSDAVAKASKKSRPQGTGQWSRSGPPGTCLCGLKVEQHAGACEACTCLMGQYHEHEEPVTYRGHVLCPDCLRHWQAYERIFGAVTWREFTRGLRPVKELVKAEGES
jgi:hypothetical protein